jgi:hypothetical protein
MAFVVLFATMSFTVDMHYCGDSLVDFSLFTKAEGCGMEKAQPVKSCGNPSISEKSCCTDQQIVKEGKDDLKTSLNKVTLEQQTFVATFFYTYINLFNGPDESFVPFKDYSPPPLIRDVQILDQTFLI